LGDGHEKGRPETELNVIFSENVLMNFTAAPIASLWFQRVTAASFFLLFLGGGAAGHLGEERKKKKS